MSRKIALIYRVALIPELKELAHSLWRSGYTLVVNKKVEEFLNPDSCPEDETLTRSLDSFGPLMNGGDDGIDLVVALLDPNMGDSEFYNTQRIVGYYTEQKIPVLVCESDFMWFLSKISFLNKAVQDWIKRKALTMVSMTQLAISVEKDRPTRTSDFV